MNNFDRVQRKFSDISRRAFIGGPMPGLSWGMTRPPSSASESGKQREQGRKGTALTRGLGRGRGRRRRGQRRR